MGAHKGPKRVSRGLEAGVAATRNNVAVLGFQWG